MDDRTPKNRKAGFWARFYDHVLPDDPAEWHPWYLFWPSRSVDGRWFFSAYVWRRRLIGGRWEYRAREVDHEIPGDW